MAGVGVSVPVPTGAQRTIRVGKYELRGRLAVGGMAELFIARTQAIHGFEKLVALKRVLPQHVSNDRLVRLLQHEARLAANLHHPNIAQVYDVGEYAGTYFFTMEYVHGKDLRDIVRAAVERGRWLPREHAVGIVTAVAGALHYAHTARGPDGKALGIVHRDVSPSNVLLTYDGVVKLVDFGIAIAATLDLNSGGQLPAGKIPYMSPEQCRDEAVDPRSDIFSLGILLWELTVGRRLFVSRGNPVALLTKISSDVAPRPSTIVPDYPPELERIVVKSLEIDRSRRYATAQELQVDLEEFARSERLANSPTRLAAYMQELFAPELREPALLSLDGVEEEKEVSIPAPTLIKPPPRAVVPMPTSEPEPEPQRRSMGLYVGVGVACVGLLAWVLLRSREPEPQAPGPEQPTQAVQAATSTSAPAKVEAPVAPAETPPPPPVAVAKDDSKPGKKADKRKKKQTWDPDSPLPPN
jgi:serine/threonine protein kinase